MTDTATFAAFSTSCSVFPWPKLKRIEFFVRSESLPNIETKTCDGSIDPAVHADPLDTATPAKSILTKNASTFDPGKLIFSTCGRDSHRFPLMEYAIPASSNTCNMISLKD